MLSAWSAAAKRAPCQARPASPTAICAGEGRGVEGAQASAGWPSGDPASQLNESGAPAQDLDTPERLKPAAANVKTVMDKFPSVEVLSRYSRHLLPTCCQHRHERPCEKMRASMRRADRLFQIIQVLRRTRKPLTADAIAVELETSKRTIYRDIATLIGQRVPIRGEAGMGYILEKGFDLPPLMLTPDEIEAAVLGAQWVAGHADPALSRAAAGSDRQDRRHRSRTPAAVRAGAGQPRPAGLAAGSPTASTWRGRGRRFTKARRSRCAIATSMAATASARSGRSRSAITKRCGSWRHGASCARIFAVFVPTG